MAIMRGDFVRQDGSHSDSHMSTSAPTSAPIGPPIQPANYPQWPMPMAPLVPHLLDRGPVLIEEMEMNGETGKYEPTGKAWRISGTVI